jgi:hypothetical protein
VKFWPGKGNPNLASRGYDVSNVLAPFYDADGDGIYDPLLKVTIRLSNREVSDLQHSRDIVVIQNMTVSLISRTRPMLTR